MKRKIIALLVLFPFFCSCLSQQQKEDVVAEQIESKYSVILGRIPAGKDIHFVRFMLSYRIKKNIPDEVYLEHSSYSFKGKCDKNKGYTMGIVPFPPLTSYPKTYPLRGREGYLDSVYKEFVYIPNHIPDTSRQTKKLLQPYMDKMNALGKDSLHIGTIEQLKKTDPELLKGFLDGDSIFIDYVKEGQRRTWSIYLPVEMK